MKQLILIAVIGFTPFLPGSTRADDWPQWRGPTGNGVCNEKNLPVEWSPEKNVAWRVALPGPAGSTPAVWGENLFLTSEDSGNVVLICLNTKGKERWRKIVGIGNKNVRGDEGNSAAPSPATDGKHVWAISANGRLVCFSTNGDRTWLVDLPKRYGKFRIAFGMTATPVLDKGKLYLQLIHGDGKASTQEALVVCLDAATGEEVWKKDRVTGASSENEHSYASPTIYRDSKHEYLVTHGGDFAIAHRLDNGNEIWRCCMNPKGDKYHPTLRFVSSPLATDGRIIIPSAKGGPVVSLKPGSKGDVSNLESARHWRQDRGTPDVPSPLYHDGLVYLCRENGNLVCIDAESGEKVYENRTVRDRHRASPVLADGKIYLTARNGTVTVVKAGRDFEILAENKMGESIAASPAISNGTIYLRTYEAIYAIR